MKMMGCLFRLLLPAAALLIAIPAGAGEALQAHTAEYKVKISVLGGRLTTRLDRLPAGYRAESAIEATGMSRLIARGAIRENSEFVETPEGLRPNVFRSDDSLTRDKEKVDFVFDWDDSEVTGTINGENFHAPLDGIVHDRVSLQYGLMHDLVNGIHRSEYALQDAEKFKPLSISNIGTRIVKVPFGDFEAMGIRHQVEGSSRMTTLWLAEDLGFLPVVIEQHRKGKLQVRAVLTNYSPTD
jgi:hypothetical protein